MHNASFLPDDYLEQRAERRANLISLVLFVVVMIGVFVAFLLTYQRRAVVKRDQTVINARYMEAADQIEDLVELENQKTDMLGKAALAAALIERVPRSFLLAEFVNRMPPRLGLTDFELTSDKIKDVIQVPASNGRLKTKRAPTRSEAEEAVKKIRPPRYIVSIRIAGVAPSGQEVSSFLAALNVYPLLRDVNLEFMEEREVLGELMQQFEITMKLQDDADVRDVEPLVASRYDNSMDEVESAIGESISSAENEE